MSSVYRGSDRYSAQKAYDNDVSTFCHTKKESLNTLTLTFEESFVVDLEMINRYSIKSTVDRLNRAKVKLVRGDVVRKNCGTTDTATELMIHRVICNEAGSSLVIELQDEYLHVAEVKIHGLSKYLQL